MPEVVAATLGAQIRNDVSGGHMSGNESGAVRRNTEGTTQFHQPGQREFRAIVSKDMDWKPLPALPPAARLAVVVGQPTELGPYTITVKVPHGEKLMPHKHPECRVYTVISGVFISDWVMNSTRVSWKPIRPAP
jgi:hypothetical protein